MVNPGRASTANFGSCAPGYESGSVASKNMTQCIAEAQIAIRRLFTTLMWSCVDPGSSEISRIAMEEST